MRATVVTRKRKSVLKYERMQEVLEAIVEPRRRSILELVDRRELSVGEIAERFDVTRPAISQHLGVLRRAGLVHERRDGNRRLYAAQPRGLAPLRAYLDRFWGRALDELKVEAEHEQRRSTP